MGSGFNCDLNLFICLFVYNGNCIDDDGRWDSTCRRETLFLWGGGGRVPFREGKTLIQCSLPLCTLSVVFFVLFYNSTFELSLKYSEKPNGQYTPKKLLQTLFLSPHTYIDRFTVVKAAKLESTVIVS